MAVRFRDVGGGVLSAKFVNTFKREPDDCPDMFGDFQCQQAPGHYGDHKAELIAEYINVREKRVAEKKGTLTWPKQ